MTCAGVWGLYVALALAATWPLMTVAHYRLPIGSEVARTVPMFNAWTMWWNADRLLEGGRGYWDAPIFYPTGNTFAMSEPQPTTMLVAPLFWATDSRTVGYNVYLWVSLVLNAVFAERFLRRLGIRRPVAIGGGAAMLLGPLVHWQIGVVQLVPVWAILWTWMALLKVAQLPARTTGWGAVARRGVELGLAYAVALMTCVHHGLFLALLMVCGAVVLGGRIVAPRVLMSLGVAVAVSLLVAAPVLYPLYAVTRDYDFVRPRDTVAQLSAQPVDYLAVWGRSAIPVSERIGREGWWLSPGWLKLGLAVVGVAAGVRLRRWRRATWLLIVMAAAAFAFSLGPNLDIRGWQPWWWIADHVPGFAQVRNVFRFAYFVHIAVVLLAAVGFAALSRWARRKRGASLFLVVLGVAAIFDPWPHRMVTGAVSDERRHWDWIQCLADNAVEGEGALCLPMSAGHRVEDFEVTTNWMLLSTYHGVPLVNGYSGFFPPRYFQLREVVMRDGLKVPAVRQLYAEGVRWIVIDRHRYRVPWGNAWILGEIRAERVCRGERRIDVYRLTAIPPAR